MMGGEKTMDLIFLAYVPALIGIFIVALFVFLKRKQSLMVYSLLYITLVIIILWLGSQMLSLLATDLQALTLLRISILFSNFVAPFLLTFAILYPPASFKPNPIAIFLTFLPAIGFSILFTSPDIVNFVHNEGIRQEFKSGLLYEVQTWYVVAYTMAAIATLFVKARKAKQQKGALLLLAFGLLLPVIVNVFVNYVLKFDSALVQYFLPISFLGMVLIIVYAMIRHHLFDIKLAIVRSATYALTLLSLSVIYYLLAYIISTTLFNDNTASVVSMNPINILLALILAFIFQPIKSLFDRITDSIFYRDRYDTNEFFARLSEVLTTTTDLRSMLERASSEIGTTLKAEQAFFFMQYDHTHHVMAGTRRHANLPVRDAYQLNEYVKKDGAGLVVSELLPENHSLHKLLISHRIAVLMPLVRGSVILGYLALGDQRSGGYTNRDIKVLKTISDELVIAIQNALSVQEVRDINKHLQQRIESATAELRTSNTQLRHLDKTKDEFLSMASHQLRTPLTSVKGYLSMVLEGDAGKVTDTQKRLLGEAFTSSERMVHLIHDFLNVSRLQTGKFMLEQHPYDIAKLVSEEVKSLQRAAETRNMKLEFTNTIGELVLNIDENKIRQVIMNFIDNALFYSHDDSTIMVELNQTDSDVELRVKDTGIGVPKGEQSQLFTKFYRASNARKQRPDGTGVGIFLAKKVITEHGGNVLFESVEGKGSTFGFTLPIEKLRVELEEKPEQSKD